MATTVSTTIQVIDKASKELDAISTEIRETGKVSEETAGKVKKVEGELDKARESSNNLKTQIRQLKDQMSQMLAEGVDPSSAAFQELAQKAGALQDAMGDANNMIKDFASDTHGIDNYTSAMQTMVGAFGVYQSAVALAGVENEELEKSMQKLVAVQTLMNSVQQISNKLQNQSNGIYKLLHANIISYTGASKGAAVATKVLNGALKAMGIGLVVAAVGLLVDHWEELVEWVKKSVPGFDGVGKVWDKIKAGAFGLGKAVMNFVITPIKTLINTFMHLKNGEFKKAFEEMGNGFIEQVKNFTEFGKNVAEGYTEELADQEKKRTEEQKKAEEERLKALKEANQKRLKALADQYAAERKVIEQNDAFIEQIDYDRKEQKLKDAKELANGLYDTKLIQEDEEEAEYTDPDAIQKYEDQMKRMQEITDETKKKMDAISTVGGSMGDVFSAIGQAAGGATGDMLSWVGSAVSTIGEVIAKMMSLSMANAAGSASALPFPANIAAMASAITSVIGVFASIPKFANGGIAYGPTVGLFGEYSGASNNPEVVAPLDKLRTIIGDTGQGGGGNVQFRIEGRDLVGVLSKENKIRSRS